MNITHSLALTLATAALLSCSASRASVSSNEPNITTHSTTGSTQNLKVLHKITDQALYQQNIVANLEFTLKKGDKTIKVPGQLRMRKDDVIRLQLMVPIIRTEVGRVEFTPDGVLVVDRLHKQYVKASYDEVSFLKNNGITFYSLQSLFWNQLCMPGEKKVGEDQLSLFQVADAQGDNALVSLADGQMSYQWTAAKTSGLISQTKVTYQSTQHGTSSLTWQYSDFKTFGSKQYPFTQVVTVQTSLTDKAKGASATFSLDDINSNADWDNRTTLSDRYTQVSAEEVLAKLMSM